MEVNWRLLKRWFIGGLVAAPIAYFFGTYVYSLDTRIPAVNRCITESETVMQHVGSVEKMTPKRRLIYFGSESEKPFRDYWLQVSGSKGRALVRVRIFEAAGGAIDECRIVEIEGP